MGTFKGGRPHESEQERLRIHGPRTWSRARRCLSLSPEDRARMLDIACSPTTPWCVPCPEGPLDDVWLARTLLSLSGPSPSGNRTTEQSMKQPDQASPSRPETPEQPISQVPSQTIIVSASARGIKRQHRDIEPSRIKLEKASRSGESAKRLKLSTNTPEGFETGLEKEGANLARLRADALRHPSGDSAPKRDPNGHITVQSYELQDPTDQDPMRPISRRTRQVVKIRQLTPIHQNCIYEAVLSWATISEVAEQYTLHLSRLENIRHAILNFERHYRQRHVGKNFIARWVAMTKHRDVQRTIELEKRRVGAEALRYLKSRDYGLKTEMGIMLRRCEKLLENADEGFQRKAWRRPTPEPKKRWADGKRGWTGVDIQDLS